MIKNKLSAGILAGIALLTGALGGTAFLASAQTTTPPNAPTVTTSTVQGAVDQPESLQDKADANSTVTPENVGGQTDTDSIQAGPGSTVEQQTGEHQDADGGAQAEANEPAGSTDTQEQ